MAPIRVLVVDDSVVARRFVSNRLEADDEIEVIGTASNGRLALQKIDRDPPDVVILDDEMPEMRGRDILKVLRAKHPTVAVVMFSGTFSPGALGTFDALSLGADDGVAKPSAGAGRVGDDHPVWTELLDKAKKAYRRPDRGGANIGVARAEERASRPAVRRRPPRPAPRPARPAPEAAAGVPAPRSRPRGRTDVDALAVIGSSTGGPEALAAVFAGLPSSFPLPIVVVQHMPPTFTRLLAERLDRLGPLTVREAHDGAQLAPGSAWIAPGDHHVLVVRELLGSHLVLDQGPPENSCRPAADPLFRSAAEAFGDRLVALVLSGMGQDGLRGSERIVDAGGRVLTQDEETSVVWGMPGYVTRAGLSSAVLPLDEIADAFTRAAHRVARGGRAERTPA